MDINKKKAKQSEKNKAHSLYVLKLETKLHDLVLREKTATQRIQLLVYPATVAFIILATYGFYLVGSLTQDVSDMADSMAKMSKNVDGNISIVADDMINMSHHMDGFVTHMDGMSVNVTHLAFAAKSMSQDVEQMSFYIGDIQQDLWRLNKNISKPLDMLNTFIPWHNDTRYRYPNSYPLQPLMQDKSLEFPDYAKTFF